MAKNLTDNFKFSGGYVDDLVMPYEDLASLKGIESEYRFEGLTVTVKQPIMMECWLVGGTMNSNWRVKSIFPIDTYAKLSEITLTILSAINKMINVGTTVVVLSDETNDGKMTEYWATEVNTKEKTVTWERKSNGGAEGEYVPLDCVKGEDTEL